MYSRLRLAPQAFQQIAQRQNGILDKLFVRHSSISSAVNSRAIANILAATIDFFNFIPQASLFFENFVLLELANQVIQRHRSNPMLFRWCDELNLIQ